jgi:hypothetical protein
MTSTESLYVVEARIGTKSLKKELEVRNGTSLKNVDDHCINVWGKHLDHFEPYDGGSNDFGNFGNGLAVVTGDF